MMRRTLRTGVLIGLVAGIVYAIVRAVRGPAAPAFERPASGAWPALAGSASPGPNMAEPAPTTAASVADDSSPDALSAPAEEATGFDPEPAPEPRAEPAEAMTGVTWLRPDGAMCPSTHPVKAKLKSGIYHQPGGLSYDRTVPDRCYVDTDAAAADGLRPTKR